MGKYVGALRMRVGNGKGKIMAEEILQEFCEEKELCVANS